MSVSLFKAYSSDQTIGTYLCDDNHGRWFIVVNGADVRATQLRELTDDGYSPEISVADVRNYKPLTLQDVEMWNREQDQDREDREDRWGGAYWED